MFTNTHSNTSIKTLALLLLPVIAIMLIACENVDEGEWVIHNSDNYTEQPDVIYYIVESKSPYGDEESVEDQYGDERTCQLLPFDKQSTTDPHGKHHYSARDMGTANWVECEPYRESSRPPLVINSIPDDLAEQMGIEKPTFTIQK